MCRIGHFFIITACTALERTLSTGNRVSEAEEPTEANRAIEKMPYASAAEQARKMGIIVGEQTRTLGTIIGISFGISCPIYDYLYLLISFHGEGSRFLIYVRTLLGEFDASLSLLSQMIDASLFSSFVFQFLFSQNRSPSTFKRNEFFAINEP